MAYIKKEFDGEYLRWYNTISANHGNVSNTLNNISISPNINGLDWKGQGQEEFCHSFSQLDVACEQMHSEILYNIEKVKMCNEVLYPKLEDLKNMCDKYNSLVDEYYSILAKRKEQNTISNSIS